MDISNNSNNQNIDIEKESGVSFEDPNKESQGGAVMELDLDEQYNIPRAGIKKDAITREILDFIPEDSALHYEIFPLGVEEGMLQVGIVDPENIEARDALNFISTKNHIPYKIYLISKADFEEAVKLYKNLSGEVTEALTELEKEIQSDQGELSEGVDIEKGEKQSEESEVDATKIIEDAPVTKIVATILRYATEGNASDVHIEHMNNNVRVRFRVDGVLNTSLVLPKKVQSAVIARIKILAQMRLDEKRKPQDGRFSAKIEGRKIDFRVSTFPTYYGEKIVMRILDQARGVKRLDQIGLSQKNLDAIANAIKKPYGMILISGPTGSGKTTTLYGMLQELDKEKKNILSLEDPIEYNIEGISQSQIRPDIGYTFANGLRTTLRQDPDIIMVGEIRDKETGQLAIQAALTGHLVLSTIHTNNAAGVIPRLVDMGIDPYLIAPTLVLAVAQRLVSKLCPDAGKAVPVEAITREKIDKEFADLPPEIRSTITYPDSVYLAEPGPGCPNGVSGRMAVMELIEMNREMERLILKAPSEQEVYDEARKQGMLTMKEDAILKAFDRQVPFDVIDTL